MKQYVVARFFWLMLSLMIFAGVDAVIGVLALGRPEGRGVFIAWMILAGICGVGAGFLIWRGEWISRIIIKPFEESKEYVHVARGVNYAIKEEMVRRQKNVERLKEEQKGMLKELIAGALVAVAGCGFFSLASTGVNLSDMESLAASFFGLTYPMLFLGAALLVAGGRMIWHAFLNSEISFAYWLADKFCVETYGIRIMRENVLIGILAKRLEKEKEEEKKRREEYLRQEQETLNSVVLDKDGIII